LERIAAPPRLTKPPRALRRFTTKKFALRGGTSKSEMRSLTNGVASELLQLVDHFLRLQPLHEVRVDVSKANNSFPVDHVRRRNRQYPAVGFIELGEIPLKYIFEGILKIIRQFKQNVVSVGNKAVRKKEPSIQRRIKGSMFDSACLNYRRLLFRSDQAFVRLTFGFLGKAPDFSPATRHT